MNNQSDEYRYYFARLKPIYRELFGMAHAICYNYDVAEYALQRAILEGWTRHRRFRSRLGFRDSLRASLKRIALLEALRRQGERLEFTWNGLAGDAIDGAQDDWLLQAAMTEPLETRRMLMLRHGCGLSVQQIAKLTQLPRAQVEQSLDRFEKRARRRLRASSHGRFEPLMTEMCLADLRGERAATPDPGAVYRTFEVEASQTRTPRKIVSRAVSVALMCVCLIALAVVFWVMAALLRPSKLETPASDAPETTVSEEQPFGSP